MMQMRDWISGLVGMIALILGLSLFVGALSFLSIPSANVLRWIVVIMGAYLLWNSIIEITNSNVLGWFSFGTSAICLLIGLLPTLPWFSIEPFSPVFYQVMLIIEGIFLMIATFAMEL